jgi:hypothetical protein
MKALTQSENLATMLAALRLFQRTYENRNAKSIYKDWPDHFLDAKGRRIKPLGSEDIDTLCEELNNNDDKMRGFVESIARMTTEEEFGLDQPSSEDWICTLSELIEGARQLTGVKP